MDCNNGLSNSFINPFIEAKKIEKTSKAVEFYQMMITDFGIAVVVGLILYSLDLPLEAQMHIEMDMLNFWV
jgi:hypothetical protein